MDYTEFWKLIPIGAGAVGGWFGRNQLNEILERTGLKPYAGKTSSLVMVVAGIYLMTTEDGILQNVGTGLSAVGVAILILDLFEDTVGGFDLGEGDEPNIILAESIFN